MEKCKIYEQIRDEAAACDHPDARIRDVAFAILAHTLKSNKIAYAVAFPGEPEKNADEYAKSPMQKVLAKRVKQLLTPKSKEVVVQAPSRSQDEITADENRSEIMRSIARLESMKDNPDLELTPKDLISIEKQLLQSRTALKEKFEVSTSAEEQLIIVEPKFNHICEQTGRECWLQTKEYAMKHWNLIEKP